MGDILFSVVSGIAWFTEHCLMNPVLFVLCKLVDAFSFLLYHISGIDLFGDHTGRVVEEFVERFPGRCMICSMHRYGFQEGHERDPRPKPHDCIEGRNDFSS